MSSTQTGTGRRVFYDDVGEGPPLLVIPGAMAGRRSVIAPLVQALASHFRVIAMDLRDEGEGAPETEYYTMGDLVSDAIAVLNAVALDARPRSAASLLPTKPTSSIRRCARSSVQRSPPTLWRPIGPSCRMTE